LQQAVPVAVQPFDFGFTALVAIPLLIVFRMIDIHGRESSHAHAGAVTLSSGSPGHPVACRCNDFSLMK
jgi:hypothetical protein